MKLAKKLLFAFFCAVNLAFIFFICYIAHSYAKGYGKTVLGIRRSNLKTAASLLFVACGLFNFLPFILRKKGISGRLFLLSGLVLAALGDIFIGKSLVQGAAFFLSAHVSFLIAFFCMDVSLRDAVLLPLFAAASVLILHFMPLYLGKNDLLCSVYAAVIALMFSKSFSLLFSRKVPLPCRIVLFLGAALFFVSDIYFALYSFGGKYYLHDRRCLMLYYPAECVLALSIGVSGFFSKS